VCWLSLLRNIFSSFSHCMTMPFFFFHCTDINNWHQSISVRCNNLGLPESMFYQAVGGLTSQVVRAMSRRPRFLYSSVPSLLPFWTCLMCHMTPHVERAYRPRGIWAPLKPVGWAWANPTSPNNRDMRHRFSKTHTHTHTHTCTRARAHTHMHTHTSTCIQMTE